MNYPNNICSKSIEDVQKHIEDFYKNHPLSKKRYDIQTLYQIKEAITEPKIYDTMVELDKRLDSLGFSMQDKIVLHYESIRELELKLWAMSEGIIEQIKKKVIKNDKTK